MDRADPERGPAGKESATAAGNATSVRSWILVCVAVLAIGSTAGFAAWLPGFALERATRSHDRCMRAIRETGGGAPAACMKSAAGWLAPPRLAPWTRGRATSLLAQLERRTAEQSLRDAVSLRPDATQRTAAARALQTTVLDREGDDAEVWHAMARAGAHRELVDGMRLSARRQTLYADDVELGLLAARELADPLALREMAALPFAPLGPAERATLLAGAWQCLLGDRAEGASRLATLVGRGRAAGEPPSEARDRATLAWAACGGRGALAATDLDDLSEATRGDLAALAAARLGARGSHSRFERYLTERSPDAAIAYLTLTLARLDGPSAVLDRIADLPEGMLRSDGFGDSCWRTPWATLGCGEASTAVDPDALARAATQLEQRVLLTSARNDEPGPRGGPGVAAEGGATNQGAGHTVQAKPRSTELAVLRAVVARAWLLVAHELSWRHRLEPLPRAIDGFVRLTTSEPLEAQLHGAALYLVARAPERAEPLLRSLLTGPLRQPRGAHDVGLRCSALHNLGLALGALGKFEAARDASAEALNLVVQDAAPAGTAPAASDHTAPCTPRWLHAALALRTGHEADVLATLRESSDSGAEPSNWLAWAAGPDEQRAVRRRLYAGAIPPVDWSALPASYYLEGAVARGAGDTEIWLDYLTMLRREQLGRDQRVDRVRVHWLARAQAARWRQDETAAQQLDENTARMSALIVDVPTSLLARLVGL